MKVSIQFGLPLQIQEILLPIPIHFKEKWIKADLGLRFDLHGKKKKKKLVFLIPDALLQKGVNKWINIPFCQSHWLQISEK